jgi:AcrR family transcriptional regulator
MTNASGRPRKTQEERREYTRKALLESTIRQIAKAGLPDCKLAHIVRGANVTTGAVQHLFGSRDELILNAIEEIFSRTSANTLEKKGDLVDRMRALGEHRVGLVGQDTYRALIDIVLNSRYNTELGRKLRKRLLEQSKGYEQWFHWYMSDFEIAPAILTLVERSMAASLYGLEILSISRWNEQEYQEILKYTIEAHIKMLQAP